MLNPNAQAKQDIAQAREKTLIDVAALRDVLYNGREQWLTHQKIVEILSVDPVFDQSRRPYMTRSERYQNGLAMANRIFELQEVHNWTRDECALAVSLTDEPSPMNLHAVAFEPVVLSQGSSDLIAKYGRLIAHRGIIGCYLQTELGHGTNVSQLETTATYVPETDEFEIHSPTLTSTKWWIGALGKTATHGVVQARLILSEKRDMGPHLFFVQLRSLDDHKPLPGRIIGDIGPKTMGGMPATDNGFARFDHVRIPREHMLSKFAQVTREGKYVQPPHAKLSYGGMLYIRSRMIVDAGRLLGKAAVVSIRYAIVRRQGNKGVDGLEQQIIKYPSVHYRLLPILAQAFVFIFLGRNLIASFDAASARLATGDTSLLADTHAITSGLKVLASTASVLGIETARRSMGGHGFSDAAGLGRVYANHLPSATYEGDNFVLDQQVVRAALKAFATILSLSKSNLLSSLPTLSPVSNYLRLLFPPTSTPLPLLSEASWTDPAVSILLLEWRAALIVQERARQRENPDASADQRVSKAVTEAFVAVQVGEIMWNLALPETTSTVVRNLLRLYLLVTVESSLVDMLSFGLLPSTSSAECSQREDSTRALRIAISQLSLELLPEAIGLTDAFGLTDWELNSALGVSDGSVYEDLWRRAQDEPLNQRDVTECYEVSIRPILLRGQRLAAERDVAKL